MGHVSGIFMWEITSLYIPLRMGCSLGFLKSSQILVVIFILIGRFMSILMDVKYTFALGNLNKNYFM